MFNFEFHSPWFLALFLLFIPLIIKDLKKRKQKGILIPSTQKIQTDNPEKSHENHLQKQIVSLIDGIQKGKPDEVKAYFDFPIKNDFNLHIKEVEKMVYEHTIRASAIDTKSFSYPEKRVFGNFYELKGQSASNIQIYITDSTRHFVTANLYFKSRPRPDSLQPAVEYIKKDLMHMIESFEWKHK